MQLTGNIVDIRNQRIFPGKMTLQDDRIIGITPTNDVYDHYIMPGFIDAHVHIESSMLVPSEFARIAVIHGTVGTVSDPHEIANVLGVDGVNYMIENGLQVPFKFNFGAPSCVPATEFETAGARIDADQILELLKMKQVKYLAEMMNYPGVITGEKEVIAKIRHAHDLGLPVDGHAPALSGSSLDDYIKTGITTDHEATSLVEAKEKLEKGMKIIIREGSAARNFNALVDLIPEYYDRMMFCSDDKHPDDLVVGHINQLVIRALEKGNNLFDVLRMACINPIDHYSLDIGDLTSGSPADFIVVQDLKRFKVLSTYINGQLVAREGQSYIESIPVKVVNNFTTSPKAVEQFAFEYRHATIRVIEAIDGELITNDLSLAPKVEAGFVVSDIARDLLKITVVNRYGEAPPEMAFVRGFGLRRGAIASCVGHDSHNIIAVGADDRSLAKVVNLVIENKGGIAVVDGKKGYALPLPVAGIMSDREGDFVARAYIDLDQRAKSMGSTMRAPFMTLSFMALLVIPSLKLSDKGLFDGSKFQFVREG